MRLAILYLVAIAGAEVVTNFLVLWKAITGAEIVTNFPFILVGIICHVVILTALVVHSSLIAESPNRKLLLALCLVPLTRIMSLSMPLAQVPMIYWYLIIYPPLFLAAWVAMRHLSFNARETGLNTRRLPLQLLVGLSGVIFGVAEYLILTEEAMEIGPQLLQTPILAGFILLVGTGFTEEFIFRGILQRASIEALGKWGIPYVALVFALLHIIHGSVIDIAFVFAIALFFGWVVNKTGSLLGVTLSHGIANIVLYLVIPFFI